MEYINTSFIPYELRSKQWKMQRKIKEELKPPPVFRYVYKENFKRSYGCTISIRNYDE